VRTQILPYVRTHTLRMKSTQSFMHEAPGEMSKEKTQIYLCTLCLYPATNTKSLFFFS